MSDLFDRTSLDAGLPTPLYHQIYLLIREKIRAGQLARDAILPGEQELAARFQVSRITVKRALNELASDGLVSRHRGRGTIVSGGPTLPVVKGSFATLIESLRLIGLETQVELIDVATVAADVTVATHLERDTGSPVQRATRRRKIGGEPFSYLVSYVPAEIAARYSIEDLATAPLLALLDRAGYAAIEAEQWITAVAAEPAIAGALDVAAGSPLLRVERVMRSAKGRPVQLIYSHYRPDRFHYHTHTRRSRTRSTGGDGWRDDQ